MIHWCGTGLSAVPGLRRLIGGGHRVAVWNRTVDKAREAVGDLTDDIRAYSFDALAAAVEPGDVVVSMLPADRHPPIAAMCVEKGAHFVSSSYISPEMRALDGAARAKGVALVNEVGLDPGIDHLMAHDLVAAYKASPAFDPANEVSFLSYCGGVPKVPNAFRYKFSWSPLGVLRALRSPSKSIRGGAEFVADRPWNALTSYEAPLSVAETFEVYPNRDSIPFMAEYGFGADWNVRDFVRGTIRLNGWAEAWAPVFAEIETLTGPEGEARLAEMAEGFWRDNAYDAGEPDRVILCVSLEARRDGAAVWHRTWAMDAWGDARGTAMARLVSVPVAMAVEAVVAGRLGAGVHAAPSEPALLADWLAEVRDLSQEMRRVDLA